MKTGIATLAVLFGLFVVAGPQASSAQAQDYFYGPPRHHDHYDHHHHHGGGYGGYYRAPVTRSRVVIATPGFSIGFGGPVVVRQPRPRVYYGPVYEPVYGPVHRGGYGGRPGCGW